MKIDTIKFLKYTEYYIWWLLNCSNNISVEQIQNDINGIIAQSDKIYYETGVYYPELECFDEIKLLGYSIPIFNAFTKLESYLQDQTLKIMVNCPRIQKTREKII